MAPDPKMPMDLAQEAEADEAPAPPPVDTDNEAAAAPEAVPDEAAVAAVTTTMLDV